MQCSKVFVLAESHVTSPHIYMFSPSSSFSRPQALGIAGELEDRMGEGVIHSNLGMTYEMLCNLEKALEHHERVTLHSQITYMQCKLCEKSGTGHCSHDILPC